MVAHVWRSRATKDVGICAAQTQAVASVVDHVRYAIRNVHRRPHWRHRPVASVETDQTIAFDYKRTKITAEGCDETNGSDDEGRHPIMLYRLGSMVERQWH